MRRLLFVLTLTSLTGCLADKGHGSWSEAAKDWRGDNMQMRSGQLNMSDTKPAAKEKLFD